MCVCVSKEKVGVYVKNGKEKVASLGVNVFWSLVRSSDGKKVLYVIL
jgi:lipoate-protein ligase B